MRNYFMELRMSFLPYRTWGSLLLGLFLMLFFSLVLRKTQEHKNIKNTGKNKIRFLMYGILAIIASISLFGMLKISHFYNFPTSLYQPAGTWWIRIFYANIYKNNTNYTWIIQTIEQEKPDLITFVEFAGHHYTNLKPYLEKNYPYTNSTSRSKTFVGNTVFSTRPLDNWADDFPQGAWRYGYFSLNVKWVLYYFYLVHVSSPSSQKFFEMRNKQIQSFFTDFWFHKRKQRNDQDKVIVLGDFNTTPWSPYYKAFADGFSAGTFLNITRVFPLMFSRTYLWFPFLKAHIDHIFINRHLVVHELRKVSIPGSDHDGFLIVIE